MTGFKRGDVVLVSFVFTDERTMVQRGLGSLSAPDLEAVESELRSSLDL
jgi:hypothetical protein